MDTLRWILLGLGAIVLLLVYLFSRPTRPKHRADLLEEASELDRSTDVELRSDVKSDEVSLDGLREQLRGLKAVMQEEPVEHEHGATLVPPEESPRKPKPASAPSANASRRAPELLVILHIAARAPRRFVGSELQHALEAEDLRFGEMDIYHRIANVDGEPQTLFSVANAVKPGTLKPEELPELETPGISLFMRLPGPVAGTEALRQLLEVGEGLAARLDGELQDESRSAMTAQTREHLRERVREWTLKYERKQ